MLASASPARLTTLSRAGVRCDVVVSGVDESAFTADGVAELASVLARAKGEAVVATLDGEEDLVVLAADTMLELDGRAWGRPSSAAEAAARWREMRGRDGDLHTGHHVAVRRAGRWESSTRTATTRVWFADLSDDEIDAYVATGEPLRVAGAFTVDSLGGPFVERIEGDHHNVVGISLPLVRRMLAELGVAWPQLWLSASPPGS